MKKIIIAILSVFVVFGNSVQINHAMNEDKVIIKDTEEEYISYVTVGNESIKIIKNKVTNDIIFEKYENDEYVTQIEFNPTESLDMYALNIDGSLLESDTGWGSFSHENDEFDAFTCPDEYVDEGLMDYFYFEIAHSSINNNYINQFNYRLEDLLEKEVELNELLTNYVYSVLIAGIAAAGAITFGNPTLAKYAALETIEAVYITTQIENCVERMTNYQDDMAFYFIELYPERIN